MAFLVLLMVTSATMMTTALTAAPAYISRTAFWIEGGRWGVWVAGSAPLVGYGWYMTAPRCIPRWRAQRRITGYPAVRAPCLAARRTACPSLSDPTLEFP